jgi:RNA polymerase sigma-70 factor (ECF subfamily)
MSPGDVLDPGAMSDLVEGLKAGRPEAFERLVRELGDRIFRFVKRLVGPQWADDVTQEVLIRVFRSIGTYQPTGRFESWIFTIANNLCIDHARKRRPEPALTEADEDLQAERFASGAPTPLEDLEVREERAALLKAVERLPLEQRQVFLLREEGGLSFREIADALSCPLNTALGRMHYAMENLRKALKTHGLR